MEFTQRQLHTFLLAMLILVAVFFRFWQIRDYVVFLGDEGRDMIIMRNMILEKRPVFIGPTASVGGFYLGPIYYWMAAPFLALSSFDPVGPSVMIATLGVATVILLYIFLKETAGFWPAILASSLYATAPLIVRYSRSSWNPNPLPFFALAQIYFIYLAIKRNNNLFFALAGLSLGISIQLHYLAVMLIPVSLLIIAANSNYKKWPQAIVLGLIGATITFSPFLAFEIRHNFPNFITIYEFVTRESTHGFKSSDIIWTISNIGNIFLEEISKVKTTPITRAIFWFLTFGGLYCLIRNYKNSHKRLIFSMGTAWFIGGLAFLRYYSGQIFDHYFGFLFPAPFFVFGITAGYFWQKNISKLVFISFTILALSWFFDNAFYKNPPNRLIDQTANVADFVIAKTEGKPYNFALISEHNSDHAYRYFLETKKVEPTELETLITNQLLVVCESKKCAPLGHPIWEIAGFGRAEIVGEWEIPDIGIRVFRLTHWPGVPSPAGKPAVKGG